MSNQAGAAQQAAIDSSSDEDVEIQGADFYRCRFYRERVPEKDTVVKVETTEIKELGATVRLLEYGGIEGFIQMSQVSTRRVRSIQKFLKIGRREMMEVYRVDKEKQYIDLSKKSLMADSLDEAEKRWKKSKKVHEIMFEVAMKLKCPIESLYEAWGWDMYESCGFEHAYDAMRVAMQDPEVVFSKITISDEHKEMLLATLARKLTVNPLKIRVDFTLTCTGYDGVEAIREALLTAKHEVNDETWNLEFKMIAPPHYKCELVTHNRNEGEAKLKQALTTIKRVMKANKGTFKQESGPQVIGTNSNETDVAELMALAERERANDESGDEEESNEEGMGDVDFADDGVVEEDDSGDEEEKKKE